MPSYRIGEVARLLGVSADTVRRYADDGRLKFTRTGGRHRRVDGADLAAFALKTDALSERRNASSARNHLIGIVTKVIRDKVAAQVEVRCGPFRIVSLLTRESVDSLRLEPGVLVTAVVKATNVVIERTGESIE